MVYVGPTGTTGWGTVRRSRQISEWTTNTDGDLTTPVVGAELFRDLDLPPICEIEISLRWKLQPGFLITFDRPNATRISKETVKLETWDDELVLQTLASSGDFEQIQTLNSSTKTIQLRLIWNQQVGELVVYSRYGELLGKLAAGPESGKGRSAIYIQNKGADLTLEHLQVSNFGGAAPSEIVDDESYVRLIDGTVVLGKVRAFDKSAESLVVSDPQGTAKKIPMQRIASVDFGGQSAATAAPQVLLSYFDGTLLRGTLDSLEGNMLALTTRFSDQIVTTHLAGARELRFLDEDSAVLVPGSDRLEFRGTKLHGKLASAGPSGALGWQPVGSSNASPLTASHPARIVRNTKSDSAKERADNGFRDIVYLRNSDVVPCRVGGIDESHLDIDSVFAERTRIPLDRVKAVEFDSEASLATSGFGGRGWVVTEKQKGTVQVSDENVVFRGQAILGHRDLMRGDHIQMDLEGHQNFRLTMSLFTRDAKRNATPGLILHFSGNQMVIQSLMAGVRRAGIVQQNLMRKGRTRLRVSLNDQKFRVFVDQKQVFSQPLGKTARRGTGIVLNVQQFGRDRLGRGKPAPKNQDILTISGFRVGRSSSAIGSLEVGDDKKEMLLTIPRHRKHNPPTHVLVAQNGDLLRGRLTSLTDDQANFTSRLDDQSFPRNRLAGIVWLADRQEVPLPANEGDRTVQAIFKNGVAFTFMAEKMVQDSIVGEHALFGACSVPVQAVRELRIGDLASRQQSVAYADWILRPAQEPKFAAGSSANGDGDGFGLDSPLVGTDVKDFDAKLLDGTQVRLSEHEGKVVILDFWATWCVPCVKEMPRLIETVDAYPKDKVVLLGVNQQENAETIRTFLKRRELAATIVLDRDAGIGRQFQVDALPQTVIVGPTGRIDRVFVGSRPDLQDIIKKALDRLTRSDPTKDAAAAGRDTGAGSAPATNGRQRPD